MIIDNAPDEILFERNLSPTARHIFTIVFRHPGRNLVELSKALAINRHAVAGHCQALVTAGWANLERARGGGCRVFPRIPHEVQKRLARELASIIDQAGYRGEALMKAWLELLLAGRDFVDNFRPDSIRYPKTDKPLELDRYLPHAKVAFEFNGLQHYRLTKKYPSQDELGEQQMRDLAKKALCGDNGSGSSR